MGRPRKDQQGPSAYKRLELAFWDLLEEKQFQGITVRSLTEKAKVNHNTFYYHFNGIEDMAAKLVRENVPKELFAQLAFMFSEGCFDASVAKQVPDLETRYHRIRLLMRNGSIGLSAIVKREVLHYWLGSMGIRESELTQSDWACIDFVWGGITALIASDHVHSLQEYLVQLEGSAAPAISQLVVRIGEGHGVGGAGGVRGDAAPA